MARRGKACVYTYWKTLGRRIGRLSKNTRRPFEKPPRHNLLFPFPPLLPQSSRRYTIVRAIWIKARRVDAYLLGIPILQLSVSRSPCSPNARPSLLTIVGRTCVCVQCNGRVHVSPMRMHVHRRKRERGVNTEWTLASEHEVWWTTDSACEGRGEGREGGRSGGLRHLHERYRVRLTDSGLKIELFIYRGVGV